MERLTGIKVKPVTHKNQPTKYRNLISRLVNHFALPIYDFIIKCINLFEFRAEIHKALTSQILIVAMIFMEKWQLKTVAIAQMVKAMGFVQVHERTWVQIPAEEEIFSFFSNL